MLHQRTTAWNTQQHVADICLNQVMLVLLWLTDTDFFKNCQISILSSLRKWYLSAKYFYLFILLWLSGRRSDVKKWDCYLFYYRISHRIICTRNDHLCWHGKKNVEQHRTVSVNQKLSHIFDTEGPGICSVYKTHQVNLLPVFAADNVTWSASRAC